MYYIIEKHEKKLNKGIATSIMCSKDMLDGYEKVELMVGKNGDNAYYHVKDSNTVIVHIEKGFCILEDYIAKDLNGNKILLPSHMCRFHYGVYQNQDEKNNRDWVKNTVTSDVVGYDIKKVLHNIQGKPVGMTLDHGDATFDEREKVKVFKNDNYNDGSHRLKIEIETTAELEKLIKFIVYNEKENDGIMKYYKKLKK
jgi:hypothetical protein